MLIQKKPQYPINLMWFRLDLRFSDNQALLRASEGSVMLVYILDPEEHVGQNSKKWLRDRLEKLELDVYYGNPVEILERLTVTHKVNCVFCTERYEPRARKLDSQIELKLKQLGVGFQSFPGSLLWNPKEVLKPDGTYYRVYTPYYKACLTRELPKPLPVVLPKRIHLNDSLQSEELAKFLPGELEVAWHQTASVRLDEFLNTGVKGYKHGRNFPARENHSRLSPYLHFGDISPLQVWNAVQQYRASLSEQELHLENQDQSTLSKDLDHFLSEIGWREFSYYLLYHFPELSSKNFQSRFDEFIWVQNLDHLSKWKLGQTGYPFVDAGMRELIQTGYIHNRVRMVVASFLTKNLLINWQAGMEWFWEYLYDADLANNSASWQWVAGTGADAAPYYRIFNPILQSKKFDPAGEYILRYIPELSGLPTELIHTPWIEPGLLERINYPAPIVDSDKTRQMALEMYKALPK